MGKQEHTTNEETGKSVLEQLYDESMASIQAREPFSFTNWSPPSHAMGDSFYALTASGDFVKVRIIVSTGCPCPLPKHIRAAGLAAVPKAPIAICLFGELTGGAKGKRSQIIKMIGAFAWNLSWCGLVPDNVEEVVCVVLMDASEMDEARDMILHYLEEEECFLFFDDTASLGVEPTVSSTRLRFDGFMKPALSRPLSVSVAPMPVFSAGLGAVHESRRADIAAYTVLSAAVRLYGTLPVAEDAQGDLSRALSGYISALTGGAVGGTPAFPFVLEWYRWTSQGKLGDISHIASVLADEHYERAAAALDEAKALDACTLAIMESRTIWTSALEQAELPVSIDFGKLALEPGESLHNERVFQGLHALAGLIPVGAPLYARWKKGISLSDLGCGRKPGNKTS